MQTFSSRDVQNHWGTVVDIAKREPVTVTQYGREAFMLVPVELGREAMRLHSASQAVGVLQAAAPAPEPSTVTILDFLSEPLTGGRSGSEIDASLAHERDAWDK